MRSSRAKVLHELLGRPLVAYPVELARGVGADPVVAVLGHQREAVEAALLARFGAGAVKVVEQTEQRGTGHAVRLAMPALRATLRRAWCWSCTATCRCCAARRCEELVGTARRYGCLAIVTATPPDPDRLRPHPARRARARHRRRRAEGRDARGAGDHRDQRRHLRRPGRTSSARPPPGLGTQQRAGRVLPDRRRRARGAHASASSAIEADFRDVAGINDRQQLAEAEAMLRARINRALDGARHLPRSRARTVVEPDVELGVDVELGRNVVAARAHARSATARASTTA